MRTRKPTASRNPQDVKTKPTADDAEDAVPVARASSPCGNVWMRQEMRIRA